MLLIAEEGRPQRRAERQISGGQSSDRHVSFGSPEEPAKASHAGGRPRPPCLDLSYENPPKAVPDVAPEVPEVPVVPEAPVRSPQRAFRRVILQHKGVRAFQLAATDGKEPTEEELRRGVYVEQIYDYYDTATRRRRIRKMTDDVLHTRTRRASITLTGPLNLRDDDEVSTGSSDTESLGSHPSSKGSPERSMLSAFAPANLRAKLMRAASMTNTEIVVAWGVLVGKVIHNRVLDFSALSDKTIRKRRFQVSTPVSSSGLWLTRLQERARLVVGQAFDLAKKIAKDPVDCLDCEWDDPGLLQYLFSTEYTDTLMLLASAVCKLLQAQPVLIRASLPCRVFGDIHGQFRDVLLLLWAFGFPEESGNMSFIFNGDFVDRGRHQVEVIGFLLALKVLMPDRIWLIRGNHEDRYMNEKYGFRSEINRCLGQDFGKKMFELIQGAFDRLPVAGLIANKVLVVHGGLGDGMWNLRDLQSVQRPLTSDSLQHPENSWIFNLLWSDPIEDGKFSDPDVFGVHTSPRGGVAAQFAWNITKTFCARNGLSLVVRSHQSKKDSTGFDVMHENLLIRVFSARDYEGHGNDGAVLSFSMGEFEGHELLKVRPQVLRSAVKSRQDRQERKERKEAQGRRHIHQTEGGPSSPGRKSRGSRSRRGSM